MESTTWKSYEEVARYLLLEFKDRFGLVDIEGKQKIKGGRSGTDWEIDAKGKRTSTDETFVIVECRRHTTSGQKQEHLAGLAYRIIDTDSSGGIIVSPFPLQEGAKKIAGAENIVEVTLNSDCSTADYVMRFLANLLLGMSDTVHPQDSLSILMIDENGNVKFDGKCK